MTGGPPRVLLGSSEFGPPGAACDEGLYLLEGRRLLLVKLPSLDKEVIEPDTETADLLACTLHGRRGVLWVHQYAQLRFASGDEREEIYSIYTPSRQGGLAMSDVDGDGYPDIYCGNYWVQNPGRAHVAWRLYANNTYFDGPDSALSRLVPVRGKGLIWSSKERTVWLKPGPDVKQMWEATLLDAPSASSLLALDSRPPLVFLGHSDGVMLLQWTGDGWSPRRLARGFSCVGLAEKNGGVWAIGADTPRLVYPLR
jgi:hypothetical protein